MLCVRCEAKWFQTSQDFHHFFLIFLRTGNSEFAWWPVVLILVLKIDVDVF